MKISDLVTSTLAQLGIEQVFSVTGGAAMHLNNSVGESPSLRVAYPHNEQACTMAAEGYARIAKKPALVVVTAGPGAINALNGVYGAFTDSVPMIVISGQPRKNTQRSHFNLLSLRQLGDQEAPILEMVSSITKATFEILESDSGSQVSEKLSEAYSLATSGRPGPVWIEIPVDVQGLDREPPSNLHTPIPKSVFPASHLIDEMISAFKKSARPIMLLGSGVRIADVASETISLAERLRIPILTAWTHDTISSSHELFIGRPGTIGTRPGNMVLQASDFILVLGSRLNIRQISYNYANFAPNAYIVQVDVDSSELKKPFPRIDLPINSDLQSFVSNPDVMKWQSDNKDANEEWVKWCVEIRREFEVKREDYPNRDSGINPYHLIPEIIESSDGDAIIVCGNATACIVPFQTAHLREGMRMFSNSGSASMGYDLPAAIGAAIAAPNRQVICFAGDGSIMMNIQELQTIANLNLNIKIVILDNGGYLSIKQTQSNFFGHFHGSTPDSGVTFPDFENISSAFGLHSQLLRRESWEGQIHNFLRISGAAVLIVKLDVEQEFEPRIKSRMVDGVIQTPSLDDMYPHLSAEIMNRVRGISVE